MAAILGVVGVLLFGIFSVALWENIANYRRWGMMSGGVSRWILEYEAWFRASIGATALYVGDSPHDEPAFAFFENSVGVAHINRFADRLQHPPTYVTRNPGGAGFSEVALHLLRARRPV